MLSIFLVLRQLLITLYYKYHNSALLVLISNYNRLLSTIFRLRISILYILLMRSLINPVLLLLVVFIYNFSRLVPLCHEVRYKVLQPQ